MSEPTSDTKGNNLKIEEWSAATSSNTDGLSVNFKIKTAEVSEERLSAKMSGPDSDIKESNSKLRKVCSNFIRYR